MIAELGFLILGGIGSLELAAQDWDAAASFDRGIDAMSILWSLDASPAEKLIELSIGHHEARWFTYAIDPTGRAFGPTQIENPKLWGTSEQELLRDPVAGYRVTLVMLREAKRVCPGTWERVLTVYVSGRCGVARTVAREICEPVGLCTEVY